MCTPQRKAEFRFLKKGSARPSFVQLKCTFTLSNRYQTMNFFLEFVPMNLDTMEELGLRTVVKTGKKASVYIVNIWFIMAFLGIFKHSLMFYNDASKVSLQKKKINTKSRCCRFWFTSLCRYIYIFYLSDSFQQKNIISFLHFSRNTDIKGPDGCLNTALKFLPAKFVNSELSLSLC